MDFSSRLSSLRKEKKLLQADVANKIGVARATYGAYEQGNRQPDFETLIIIADFFDVTLDYLLGRSNILKSTTQYINETEFQTLIKNPELQIWYNDLPKSTEEELRRLKTIWEMIKNENK